MRPIVVAGLGLLLVGCSGSAEHPSVACALTSMPHGTLVEQAAVRARAQGVLAQPGKATKPQLKAVLEIVESQVTLPTDLPSPLATALKPGGNPYGLPSLDQSLQHLKAACR